MSAARELLTIGQLTDQVAVALRHEPSSDAREARADRRVREVPDTRTIRWYQTTGLVDRPAAMRGRTALYGRRHLLQLLAIKRLQAAGKALSEIQAELAGAPDATLATLAGATEAVPMTAASAPGIARTSRADGFEAAAADQPVAVPPAPQDRFWASAPAATTVAAMPDEAVPSPHEPVDLVTGVRVDGSLVLLVEGLTRTVESDDVAAIRRAARPLVETLRRRGLVTSQAGSYPPSPPNI